MKRVVAISSFVFLMAASVFALSLAPANFSGTWVLDNAKSEGLRGRMADAEVTMKVTQDGAKLVEETTTGDNTQSLTFNLDGSETTAEFQGRMPSKGTIKAKWMDDGKMLEITQVRNLNFQGNDVTINVKEHWQLSEDGKVLNIHRTTESPRGTMESKLVFNKK